MKGEIWIDDVFIKAQSKRKISEEEKIQIVEAIRKVLDNSRCKPKVFIKPNRYPDYIDDDSEYFFTEGMVFSRFCGYNYASIQDLEFDKKRKQIATRDIQFHKSTMRCQRTFIKDVELNSKYMSTIFENEFFKDDV